MNNLPNDILNIIYTMKHKMEFADVINELKQNRKEAYESVINEVYPYFVKSITDDNPDERYYEDFMLDVTDHIRHWNIDVDTDSELFTQLMKTSYVRAVYFASAIDQFVL